MATFNHYGVRRGVRKILSHCPHCVNSFRNDYPQLGADLEVVHHTQYLTELVAAGRLMVPAGRRDATGQSLSVTYHDPCYLARVAGETESPRKLLSLASQELHEMPRHGAKTSCCGAGGGRMWFEDAAATRTGRGRIDEAMSTGETTLAVSCPFCLTMMADGLAARGGGMIVRDVAEILADAIFQDNPTPAS